MVSCISLWTWQGKGYSLLESKRDISKSEYCETEPEYLSASEKLRELLGTDQIIWCDLAKPEEQMLNQNSKTKALWKLEVPEDKILRFVDSYIWNKILGIECRLPMGLRERCWQESINSNRHFREILEECRKEFFAPRPEEDLWTELFIEDYLKKGANAIIPHPVEEGWIRNIRY